MSLFQFSRKGNNSDLIIAPFWEGVKQSAYKLEASLEQAIAPSVKAFSGVHGQSQLIFLKGETVLLLGLGKQEKNTTETLRRAYAAAIKVAREKKYKTITVLYPHDWEHRFLTAIMEGVILSNYSFTYKKEEPFAVEKVFLVGIDKPPDLEKVEVICEGINFIRSWVNQNADDKIPKVMADMAKKLHPKIKTEIFDKKRLKEEKMGLILAVNRGSEHDPFLVQASYRGNPKSKDHYVLVGKGVTYDTGGLSLKPTDGMLTMKCDMSGAATVLGVLKTVALLGLKINVTALAPFTENGIDAKSYKLGDVYESYSGKTVEINNTDAEGRLVLADAIAYAVKNLKPKCIIDLASLTGACVVALGEDIAGLFSNNETLAEDLLESAEKTDELLWQLPIREEYKESFKSDIADLTNSGGREGGAIKGAIFIQEFVNDVPWAHIDLAGPCFLNKAKYYHPTKATGYGLKLLINFLERKAK